MLDQEPFYVDFACLLLVIMDFLWFLLTVQKTFMFRPIGDSQVPLGLSVRVNDLCLVTGLDRVYSQKSLLTPSSYKAAKIMDEWMNPEFTARLFCATSPLSFIRPSIRSLPAFTRRQFGVYLQGNVECHQPSSRCLPSEVNILPETQNVNGENFLRCCLT